MSEHLWRVEIELKRNMVDYWNDCFDDLHILKPDYSTIEKAPDRHTIMALLFDENEWGKLERKKKYRMKKLMTEISPVDLTELMKSTLRENEKQLQKQIEIFETRAKNDEKYIENLTKQLDQQNSNVNTLNKLLENQQILALESNKKIQKLESQLEEERQLNYSFDTATNNRQNINPQEATFTEESQNINQQQTKRQPTEVNYKDIAEEKKNDSTNEGELTKEDKFVEETKSDPDDNREVEPPKKGFWSRLFGN
ncbi:TPA: DUF536 domain-containing protein [Staphylococcus aureus]